MNYTLQTARNGTYLPETSRHVLFSLILIPALCLYLAYARKTNRTKFGLPVVGHRTFWEPKWLVRLRFIRGSRSMIKEGYDKVSSLSDWVAILWVYKAHQRLSSIETCLWSVA